MKCEFYSDRSGKMEYCDKTATTQLRQKGMAGLAFAGWRPWVCDEHRAYLLSPKVQAAGREWEDVTPPRSIARKRQKVEP